MKKQLHPSRTIEKIYFFFLASKWNKTERSPLQGDLGVKSRQKSTNYGNTLATLFLTTWQPIVYASLRIRIFEIQPSKWNILATFCAFKATILATLCSRSHKNHSKREQKRIMENHYAKPSGLSARQRRLPIVYQGTIPSL